MCRRSTGRCSAVALTSCCFPGCSKVFPHGTECSIHPDYWANLTPQQRRPHVSAHNDIRKRTLDRANHRCQIRYPLICIFVATEVDRIDNEWGYKTPGNTAAACSACHGRKTQWEAHTAQGHDVEHLKPPNHHAPVPVPMPMPVQSSHVQSPAVPQRIDTTDQPKAMPSYDLDPDDILRQWREQGGHAPGTFR
jgi:5-methylcytosine-specific restriction enzyme A